MAGLFQLTQGLREGKFPVLLRRDGTRPEWPYFVLGARDPAAPAALRAYAKGCEAAGLDPQYVSDLRTLADNFDAYREEAGDGDPDAPKHRQDNPAVLAFPASLAEHDARVRAETLEEAADTLLVEGAALPLGAAADSGPLAGAPAYNVRAWAARWLRTRAADVDRV